MGTNCKKACVAILFILCAFAQTAFAGDWTKRYIKDAFGDEDYSQPVYTVNLTGTTDVVRPNEQCILGLMAKPASGFTVFRAFMYRGGEPQNFWSDTQIYVKLSNGKKFNIPCDVADGNVWLGNTPKECHAIADILNNGNFTLVIVSRNYDITMKCTFNIGSQTTGLKRLLNQ